MLLGRVLSRSRRLCARGAACGAQRRHLAVSSENDKGPWPSPSIDMSHAMNFVGSMCTKDLHATLDKKGLVVVLVHSGPSSASSSSSLRPLSVRMRRFFEWSGLSTHIAHMDATVASPLASTGQRTLPALLQSRLEGWKADAGSNNQCLIIEATLSKDGAGDATPQLSLSADAPCLDGMELWAVHVADGSPAPFPSGRPNVESDEEVIFPSPIAGTVALATSQRPMALQLWAEFNHFIATTLPSKRLSVTYPKQQHGQHNEEAKTPQTAPMVPQLWLSRHGQSMSNLTLRIGEDSPLSPNGQQYALWLNKKMQEITSPHVYSNLHVWTSHLQRTLQTAYNLPNGRKHHVQGVNELDAGLCDGMSYEKIKEEKPWVYDGRKNDKFAYNYPEGESYVSILRRAYPMIRRLEGVGMREHFVGADPHSETGPVLLVAHNAVIRVIYGYMTGATSEHIPRIPIPLHTLIQLTPLPFAGPDSVSPGAQVSSGSGAPASCGYVETRISMEGAEHLAEAPSA